MYNTITFIKYGSYILRRCHTWRKNTPTMDCIHQVMSPNFNLDSKLGGPYRAWDQFGSG